MTDEQLMSQVKGGQLNVLNALFERYSPRIYSYFLKSTLDKSDSDDLTQELFIRVLKYRKSYKEAQRFELWVFQIARNMIKDHFKKMKVHRDHIYDTEIIPDIAEENRSEEMERESLLYQAMHHLDPDKRELLVLSKFNGMKYEQIAKLRKTSVSNIKVQVHRTIKELKTIYFEQKDLSYGA